MDRNHENKSIQCSVQQCEYHSDCADFCSLDSVKIGTHEMNPTQTECVDCMSFKKK